MIVPVSGDGQDDAEDGDYGGLAGAISGPDGENLFWDGTEADDKFGGELDDAETGDYEDSTRLVTGDMTGDDAPDNMDELDFDETWDTAEDDYPVSEALDEDRQLNAR